MKPRRWRTYLFAVVGVVVVAIAIGIFLYADPKRVLLEGQLSTPEKIRELNHMAGVETPHFRLGKELRSQNLVLFERVEGGTPLSEEDSKTYRLLYQRILEEHRWLLGLFDFQLCAMTDVELESENNVGGRGIAGTFDHHDRSARDNFERVIRAVKALEQKDKAEFLKAWAARQGYKDLTDILLHLATVPHTKSIKYRGNPTNGSMEGKFERTLELFKAAQFYPVNSAPYNAAVADSLEAYRGLVEEYNAVVVRSLGLVR